MPSGFSVCFGYSSDGYVFSTAVFSPRLITCASGPRRQRAQGGASDQGYGREIRPIFTGYGRVVTLFLGLLFQWLGVTLARVSPLCSFAILRFLRVLR